MRDGLLLVQERQIAKDVKQTIPLAGYDFLVCFTLILSNAFFSVAE